MKKIILLLVIVFASCKETTNNSLPQSKENSVIEKIDDLIKTNQTVITGTTDHLNAFKYLNVMNRTYLLPRSHLDVTKDIFPDSIHMVLNAIEKPLFMEIGIFPSGTFYRGWAFVIPGDTISIRLKKGVMTFFGKNAILNNYWSQMDKATPEYARNPYLGNLNNYKKNVKSIYNKKLAFFNQYTKKYAIQSELFTTTIKRHLRHQYLDVLISPKNIKTKMEGYYYSDYGGLTSIIQKESAKNPELIFDLSNYFGSISIEEFKDVNALNNFYFRNNIMAFLRYYFLDSKYVAFSKEKFIAEKEFIQKNFEGEIENYAIAILLREYYLKGFGNGINTIEIMKSLMNEYENKFTKPSYVEFMKDLKKDLATHNFELRESALNSKFINIIGDTLTLKNIFARSSERIKVVDFWASWCPPCIKQIKEGKPFKDRLQVENNVEWIYISPEKDYKKWLEANRKFKDVLNFNNSFFLLKGRKSSLARSFNVKEIPRYVIFNEKNKIVLNNAPSPSDKEIFERIIDEIYDKK